MSDILKEENGLRVKLALDEYPDEPYDDGQSPLLRIDHDHTEHVMATGRPLDDDSRIEEAAERWYQSGDHGKLQKYLRAFHGATQIVWYGPNNATDYTYVTYDTARWRKYAGWNEGDVPQEGAVNLSEYRAYLEGEVYFYAVERKLTGAKVYDAPDVDDRQFEEWETVDSCGGFYGYEWAKEAALEAYESAKNDA